MTSSARPTRATSPPGPPTCTPGATTARSSRTARSTTAPRRTTTPGRSTLSRTTAPSSTTTPAPLLDCLEALAAEAGDEGLEDIGHGALPSLVGAGEARDLRHDGYWRDVGTIPSYWRGHQELLGDEPAFRLDDPELPLLTKVQRTGPARLRRTAEVDDSLLAPGSDVAGEVERCVLGAGVVVEEGAVVRESVLLPGVVVRRGAVVEGAVLDDRAVVAPGVHVGGPGGDIALVGRAEEVTADLPAGARLPAPDD